MGGQKKEEVARTTSLKEGLCTLHPQIHPEKATMYTLGVDTICNFAAYVTSNVILLMHKQVQLCNLLGNVTVCKQWMVHSVNTVLSCILFMSHEKLHHLSPH